MVALIGLPAVPLCFWIITSQQTFSQVIWAVQLTKQKVNCFVLRITQLSDATTVRRWDGVTWPAMMQSRKRPRRGKDWLRQVGRELRQRWEELIDTSGHWSVDPLSVLGTTLIQYSLKEGRAFTRETFVRCQVIRRETKRKKDNADTS